MGLQGNEPLFRCPEDDRFFAAPAVGVGVFNLFLVKQMTQLFQFLNDVSIAVEDVHAFEKFNAFDKLTFFIDRGIDIETILKSCLIILFAVARRDVDSARTGIGGNIIGIDDDRLPVDERVSEGHIFQGFRRYFPDDFIINNAGLARDIFGKVFEGNVYSFLCLDCHIGEIGMDRYGKVRG